MTEAAVEGTLSDPSDTSVYVVTYDNGVAEEVTGLDAVRRKIWSPETRVAEGQDAGPLATYELKR